MLLMQAQENWVALYEEQLLFIAGGQDNAIDEDVDEQPVKDLSLNVDNMFQADDFMMLLILMLFEAPLLTDAVYEHHDVHEMHDDVQPNYVVDSHADYTRCSNYNSIGFNVSFVTTQNNVVGKFT
ncbi:hypothetical protein Tco_1211048 [Tanacetum coccineum]